MICYLDIDEVLVDFVGPALRLHDLDPDLVRAAWPEDTWSVTEVLGMSNTKFWKPINEMGSEFWENLPEKPWIDELLYLVSSTFEEAYLVSAPSHCTSSYQGKVNWIRKRFGNGFDKFVLSSHKHLLGYPGAVLIDDRPKNCVAFEQGPPGGIGGKYVLFPMTGNANARYLDNPIKYVKELLPNVLDQNPYTFRATRTCRTSTARPNQAGLCKEVPEGRVWKSGTDVEQS